MVDGHNWNQLHHVLLDRLRYRQVIDAMHGVISYEHPTRRPLVIARSNDMSCEYLETILGQIGITYEEFSEMVSNR
jgi:gamma-glutamyl phosphate reductase